VLPAKVPGSGSVEVEGAERSVLEFVTRFSFLSHGKKWVVGLY
jgi:hypothetical protein